MEALDLKGRKGLVVGIANEHSLAWWAAEHFHNAGSELAITYLNDKAKPFVEPLAKRLDAPIFLPCNVSVAGQLDAVFEAMHKQWGRLDFMFHSPWAHPYTSGATAPTPEYEVDRRSVPRLRFGHSAPWLRSMSWTSSGSHSFRALLLRRLSKG